jgi:hypothetical protein
MSLNGLLARSRSTTSVRAHAWAIDSRNLGATLKVAVRLCNYFDSTPRFFRFELVILHIGYLNPCIFNWRNEIMFFRETQPPRHLHHGMDFQLFYLGFFLDAMVVANPACVGKLA